MRLQEANYYKCTGCGYEFLSNSKTPVCPHCKVDRLEHMDAKNLVGFDG
jgi:predicted Zn-ribbon and HTH transcriptional regulator